MKIGAEREIDGCYLRDPSMTIEIAKSVVSDMKMSILSKLLDEVECDKSYIIRLNLMHERSIRQFPNQRIIMMLDVRDVPQETVEVYREYKLVTVDSLVIENINCRNCAAPIPVGRLDSHRDTLVRCSYCGTYHTIRKK